MTGTSHHRKLEIKHNTGNTGGSSTIKMDTGNGNSNSSTAPHKRS
jgi:hypothetical protein